MAEKISSSGLSQEDNTESQRLHDRHKSHAESLVHAREVMARADAMRKIVERARENGTVEDIPYHDRVFANGELTQQSMVQHAQLHYDANMWQVREHYQQNQEGYMEQAVKDAADAGVDINLSDAAAAASDIIKSEKRKS